MVRSHSGVTTGVCVCVCVCVMGWGVAGAGLEGTGPEQPQLHVLKGRTCSPILAVTELGS